MDLGLIPFSLLDSLGFSEELICVPTVFLETYQSISTRIFGVHLTVTDQAVQETRSEEDIPKGIVKFLVDVYDETGETVAIATILTMVAKRR